MRKGWRGSRGNEVGSRRCSLQCGRQVSEGRRDSWRSREVPSGALAVGDRGRVSCEDKGLRDEALVVPGSAALCSSRVREGYTQAPGFGDPYLARPQTCRRDDQIWSLLEPANREEGEPLTRASC